MHTQLHSSILRSGYYPHGFWHVPPVYMWVSSRFFTFFPPPKYMLVGQLAALNCPKL